MIYYKESQKIRSIWVWAIFGLTSLIMLGVIIQILSDAFHQQNTETSTHWLVVLAIFISALLAGTGALLYNANLQLQIKDRAVYYKYFPFIRGWKKIKRADINRYSLRQYKAIKEYGGWGYRLSFNKGRALTVKGKHGLQLNYANDKNLLIGTQKPEEVEKVMNELMKKEDNHG